MSKVRIQSSRRKARRSSEVKSSDFERYLGLSLSGGRADKSCLAALEYFPKQRRLFLSRLHDRIRAEDSLSADQKIIDMVRHLDEGLVSVCLDAPLSLPKCLTCKLKCPGYETCSVPELKWMRTELASLPKRRPERMITPYTQRPIDLYLSELEEKNLDVQHALGANMAPLTARAHFLERRISVETYEVPTKLSVWRLGTELKVAPRQLLSYRNSVGGEEARRLFLQAFCERTGLFIYHQDQKVLCESAHAFDSVIAAFVGYLKEHSKVEPRAEGFPRDEKWVLFPKRRGSF